MPTQDEEEKAKPEEAAKVTEEKAKAAAKNKKPKTYKPGDKLGKLVATTAGLPNTCAATGAEIKEGYWFAAHEDAARSGQGFCQAYAEELAAADK